jgi:hypothetical protein
MAFEMALIPPVCAESARCGREKDRRRPWAGIAFVAHVPQDHVGAAAAAHILERDQIAGSRAVLDSRAANSGLALRVASGVNRYGIPETRVI